MFSFSDEDMLSGRSYRGPRSNADQKRLQCGGNRQGGSWTAGDETLGELVWGRVGWKIRVQAQKV